MTNRTARQVLWYAAVIIGTISSLLDNINGVITAIFVLVLLISVKD